MFSIFIKTPVAKEKSLPFRICLLSLSVICSVFILAPTIAYYIKSSSPLTEMPENGWYYFFRGLFAICLLFSAVHYLFIKKTPVFLLPCVTALIATLFPLFSKIKIYNDYKSFIEQFSMTANYQSYLINIGIYVLFTLVCVLTILKIFGLTPDIVIYVLSALTITAVIFITIDRAKNIEYDIFNIFDILCFSYVCLVSLLPVILCASTEKNNNDNHKRKERYKAKRLRK